MQKGEGSGKIEGKNRKTILRDEREKKKVVEVRKSVKKGEELRKVTVKVGLERINMQKEITVEVLLDSDVIELVINSEFTKRKGAQVEEDQEAYICKKCEQFFQ